MSLRHRSAGLLMFMAVALAGACSSDSVANGDGDTSTGDTSGSCVAGHLDCECSEGLCLGDLECVDEVCVSPVCIPGYLGCDCIEGLCLQGLECVAEICSDPGGDGDPGDGDGDPGDGDGDPGDGDGDPGDGDGDGGACGDGNLDPGETCDDGNSENGDGCNNDCTESGQLLWQELFHVLENDMLQGIDDFANGVAVDSSDHIYVAGMSQVSANETDGWYRKYTPGGQLVWDRVIDGESENGSRDGCYRIAVDVNNHLAIACWYSPDNTQGLLRKINADGDEIWSQELIGRGQGVDVAPDGTIAVSGSYILMQGFVSRFNSNGAEIWTRTYNLGNLGSRAVKYTASGDLVVVMHTGRHARLYTADGTTGWSWGKNTGQSYGLAIDGDEILIGGGHADPPHVGWFGRLDADGMLLSEQTWNGDTSAMANDIAVDSAGNVVVVGNISVLGQGVWTSTRKYSPDGRTLLWERRLQGVVVDGFNEAIGVAIDSDDNIIVVGALAHVGNNKEAFVAKYSP